MRSHHGLASIQEDHHPGAHSGAGIRFCVAAVVDAPLTFWSLDVRLVPRLSLDLPAFPGTLLRSAFGVALRRSVCTTGAPTCQGCPHVRSCAYGSAFETPLAAADAHPGLGGQSAPHPFVLGLDDPTAHRTVAAGAPLDVQLSLIGSGRSFLAPFILALGSLAQSGLGRDRIPLDLVAVTDRATGDRLWDAQERVFVGVPTDRTPATLLSHRPVPSAGRVRLVSLTPLRLLDKGRPVKGLTPTELTRNLVRRFTALGHCHCGVDIEVDTKSLSERAGQLTVTHDTLAWTDLERYSRRQARTMTLGGLAGTLELTGDLEPLWPWLLLGEALHVGKGTAFGLGRYTLETP